MSLALFRAPESLEATLARHRRELLAREDDVARAMQASWRGVERDLLARIALVADKVLAARAAGTAITPNWLYRQDRMLQLLSATRARGARYGRLGSREAEAVQRDAARMGARHAGQSVLAATREARVTSAFVRLPVPAVERLVGAIADGSPLADVFAPYGDDAARRVGQAMAQEMAIAGSPDRIATAVRRAASAGLDGLPTALRKELTMTRDRAVLIARTESLRAYRGALTDSFALNDDVVEGWYWHSALDERTCPICVAMHGTVYRADQAWPGSHPACRCGCAPLVAGRRPRTTGAQWLRTRPEAEQLARLGRARLARFKETGDLSELTTATDHPRWGGGRKLTPLKELANRP